MIFKAHFYPFFFWDAWHLLSPSSAQTGEVLMLLRHVR
jgi:hypothetical protein